MDRATIIRRLVDTDDIDGRTTLLNQLCGDDSELRQQVVNDLAQQNVSVNIADFPSRPDRTLTEAASVKRPIARANDSEIGTTLGRYHLVERLGEGGMGVVYLAQQEQPVRRQVAVKVTKADRNSPELVARFQAERQALALMDHENIAKVLDAGTTDDGRLYFVMELVRGAAITDFCDQRRLTTNDRLQLFVAVCNALQHAHQKGVIHRDVKPSNVLVIEQDGRAIPKVIDFGLAKALEEQLAPQTLHTQFGQVLGTLEYMSPEQANFGTLDLDTRTDVYSLGVLLYELLTGTTPLGRQRLRSAPFDQVLKIIREEEPVRPSTRVSELGETQAEVAELHATDAHRLREEFRGDLDCIVRKALEKDRERRYGSAAALAVDVERFLRFEPIEARPPSALYLAQKFARRNRALVAGLAAVLLAITVGIGASTYFAISANRAAKRAQTQAEVARRQRNLALETLQDVVFQIQVPLAEIPAARPVQQEMLEGAIVGLKRIAEEFEDDWSSSRVMMVALEDLGDLFLNLGPSADEALEMDHREFAEQQFLRAKKIADRHMEQWPEDEDARYDLAMAETRIGKVQATLDRMDEAIESMSTAAELLNGLADEKPERYLGVYFVTCFRLSGYNFIAGHLNEALRWTNEGLKVARDVEANQLKLHEPIPGYTVDELELRSAVFTLLPEACADIQVALEQPERIKRRLLIDRSKHFLMQDNAEEAARTLEPLGKIQDLDASTCYSAACRYTRCAELVLKGRSREDLGDEVERYETYCKAAISMLLKAGEFGFFDDGTLGLQLLNSDPDLDPIRDREEFRQFANELRAAAE